MDTAALNAITDPTTLRAMVRSQLAEVALWDAAIAKHAAAIAERDHTIRVHDLKIDKLTFELARLAACSQCVLADTAGEADFVLVHEAPGYSGLRPRHYDAPVTTEIIRVDVKRLDDLIGGISPMRFIKIDCEGAELRVLRGAKNLLMRDRPVVSFECGNASLESYDYDAGDIYDFLDGHG